MRRGVIFISFITVVLVPFSLLSYHLIYYPQKSYNADFHRRGNHIFYLLQEGSHQNADFRRGNHIFYLQGSHQTVPGIGHSFMSFHHLVMLALQNKLTPHFSFWNNGHGLDKEQTKAYFFGDLFDHFKQRQKSDAECQMIKSSTSELASKVLMQEARILKSANVTLRSNSSQHHTECTVFTLNDEIYPSEEGMDSNLPYCRRLFELNDVLRKKMASKEQLIKEAYPENEVFK